MVSWWPPGTRCLWRTENVMELKKQDVAERPNAILMGLQDGRHIYQGTVSAATKAKRRAANKVSRRARRAGR
jgi:hypothetical protein